MLERVSTTLLVFFAVALATVGCEKYDSPPQVQIRDIEDGILPDPSAPIVLEFQEPVKADTLKVRIVLVLRGEEGDLLADADVFFDSEAQTGGTGTLNEARTRYTIELDSTLPVGPRLGLELAAGLSDDEGNDWNVDQLVEFAYGFSCDPEDMEPTTFPSAVHFLLVDVEEPLAVQLPLLADIRVDSANGTFVGQFTDADRDPAIDCSQFGLDCAAEEVCRTLPEPECVVPSTSALTTDEYPDYTHNVPPEGFSFTATGCVKDQPDGTWAFTNDPVDVDVNMPQVRVLQIGLNASFAVDDEGVLRASGSFTALDILLGSVMSSSGAGSGSITTREIPSDEVKPGLPPPP
jgi:hypothetical protein